MVSFKFVTGLLLASSLVASAPAADVTLRDDASKVQILDFNIKNDANPTDLETGEEPWSTRKTGVISAIKNCTDEYPTLVGLQEVVEHQLTDILDGLGDGWTYYGVPRGNNGSDNELNPIIYNVNQFDLLDNSTVWYGSSPQDEAPAWGEKYPRIVTITEFRHKNSGKTFHFLNTHFASYSDEARTNSAQELLNITSTLHSGAILLGGDFNSRDNTTAYSILTEEYQDANKAAKSSKRDEFTIDYDAVIDYIFFKKQDDFSLQLLDFTTGSGVYDGYFISDHTPIWALFSL